MLNPRKKAQEIAGQIKTAADKAGAAVTFAAGVAVCALLVAIIALVVSLKGRARARA